MMPNGPRTITCDHCGKTAQYDPDGENSEAAYKTWAEVHSCSVFISPASMSAVYIPWREYSISEQEAFLGEGGNE